MTIGVGEQECVIKFGKRTLDIAAGGMYRDKKRNSFYHDFTATALPDGATDGASLTSIVNSNIYAYVHTPDGIIRHHYQICPNMIMKTHQLPEVSLHRHYFQTAKCFWGIYCSKSIKSSSLITGIRGKLLTRACARRIKC